MPGFNIHGSGNGPVARLETLRSNRWLISQFGTLYGDQLLIAKELTLPDLRVESLDVLGGMLWYKYAKAVRWEDATITFYDDGVIAQSVDEWRQLVYDHTSGIKTHSPNGGYKKDCTFNLLDGSGGILNVVKLINAWPRQVSPGRLTYTESEIKMLTVTLAFDYAITSGSK